MQSDEELRRKAEKRAEEKIGLYVHLTVYIFVNLMLIVIWYLNGGSAWLQDQSSGIFPWFIFPLLGWGIGLAAHIVGTYASTNLKDRIAEKEYQKLKNK
jgi:hypothetical protein